MEQPMRGVQWTNTLTEEREAQPGKKENRRAGIDLVPLAESATGRASGDWHR